MLVGSWVAIDGRARLAGLLAVGAGDDDRRARRKVVLVHAGVELALFVVAVGVAVFLVTVPAGVIGALGFFPLLRGLGGLTSAQFLVPRRDPVLPEADGSLSVRSIARASGVGGIDRLALFVPVLALATGGEMIVVGVGLWAILLVVSLRASRRPSGGAGQQVHDRRRAWLQVLVGLVVLVASGMFNWLIEARG
jgi:hypothetical protein